MYANKMIAALARSAAGVVAAIAVTWVVSASSQESSGQYEIRVSWGSSSSMLHSSFLVVPGETVEVEIAENSVLVSLQPLSDLDYNVQVTTKPSTDTGLISAGQSAVRRSAFGAPVELAEISNTPDRAGAYISVFRLASE